MYILTQKTFILITIEFSCFRIMYLITRKNNYNGPCQELSYSWGIKSRLPRLKGIAMNVNFKWSVSFKWFFSVIFFILFTAAYAGDSDIGLLFREKPWRYYPAVAADKSLARVLLIGDSIMNGYRGPVARLLKGKANVDVWLTPLWLNRDELHHDLQRVLEQGPYDVIHFNIGLHGWQPGRIPDGQYKLLMEAYVQILRSHSARVKLIWGSTTQLTVQAKPTELDPEHNPTIAERNRMAAEVMAQYDIPVNDLYGFMSDKLQLGVGDRCHWQGRAYELMAQQVVRHITDSLGQRDKRLPVFYISPNGKDTNNGSKKKPFKTLERARDAVRQWKKTHKTEKQTILIFLRKGVYERANIFALNEQDSGWQNAPVIWRACPGEEVRIIGGKQISVAEANSVTDHDVRGRIIEKHARDNILRIDLKKQGIMDYGKLRPRGFRRPYIPAHLELFVDDVAQRLAQWPNPGQDRIPIGKVVDKGSQPRYGDFSNRGGKFHYNTERPKFWKQANNVWISGFFNKGYADDTVKIKNIDQENSIIETAQPHMYGFRSGRAWNRWFALNLLEEIDQPGEYYVDQMDGILYFYPPKSFDLKRSRIQISILEEPMVALEGTSHVHFEGVIFECTRGMGFYIERGSSNRIRGCIIRNMGMVAICVGRGTEDLLNYAHAGTATPAGRRLGSWHEHLYDNPVFDRDGGEDHGIVSCDIYGIGAGAVHLGGGNRGTLEPAGNFVRNCHIYDFNRLGRSYKAGVNIDGVGNRVQHCNIHTAPSSGIYVHGNEHLFEYNEIHRVMLDGDDMGAWYMGRDPSEFGNVIRYNFFHHIGRTPQTHSTWGIYYDDMACGTQAYGNVFYKVGKSAAFLVGGGKYNEIENNIFINCRLCVQMGNRGQTWARGNLKKGGLFEKRTLQAVNIAQAPYCLRYPNLAGYWDDDPGKPANLISKNLAVQCGRLTNAKPEWGPIENNWMTQNDPGFVNMPEGNYDLKSDSPVFEKIAGFKPVPFSKMGLYRDPWRRELPK